MGDVFAYHAQYLYNLTYDLKGLFFCHGIKKVFPESNLRPQESLSPIWYKKGLSIIIPKTPMISFTDMVIITFSFFCEIGGFLASVFWSGVISATPVQTDGISTTPMQKSGFYAIPVQSGWVSTLTCTNTFNIFSLRQSTFFIVGIYNGKCQI